MLRREAGVQIIAGWRTGLLHYVGHRAAVAAAAPAELVSVRRTAEAFASRSSGHDSLALAVTTAKGRNSRRPTRRLSGARGCLLGGCREPG
eukprot:4000946-Pyramimonas_sp.AAC.1